MWRPRNAEQTRRVLEALFLWAMSLPDNLRDGMTAVEVSEVAWLMDDAIGATAQAEHLLTKLVQGGFPVRGEKKTRDGKEVVVYSYETSVAQDNPVRLFGPLKKKAKEEITIQDLKWVESLFWQLPDITKEAQDGSRALTVESRGFPTLRPAIRSRPPSREVCDVSVPPHRCNLHEACTQGSVWRRSDRE